MESVRYHCPAYLTGIDIYDGLEGSQLRFEKCRGVRKIQHVHEQIQNRKITPVEQGL